MMKRTLLVIVMLLFVMAIPARADITLNIKLNLFGTQTTEQGKSQVTTSFYLKSMVQRNRQVAFSTEALQAELKKTFNVPGVSLLAEGDLVWRSGGEPSVTQIVQINGRAIAMVLTPLPRPGAVNFKVGVVEENDKKNIKNILLDTEIVLPDGEVAMLGFRDTQENSCFIAFCVQGRDEKISKDVLRLAASQAPRKIKDVKPLYPEEAFKNRIQGVVVGKVETDIYGRVRLAEVLSGHPLFNDAALMAVKQWIYEPYIVDGKAQAVSFTFIVNFRLNVGPGNKNSEPNALTRLEDSQKPKIIKKVSPAYPEAALLHKVEGVVVLEVTIDEQGKVKAARIVSYSSPILNQAALDAVRQWEYEPFVKGGKAKKVTFTVAVTFSMDQERFEGIPPK
jgi:TonB family protein